MNALLKLFAERSSRKEYLNGVIDRLREWSGCRCVGIRVLNRHGDIPYESYTGFSPEFWASENPLSLNRDQCVCTRLIAGTLAPHDLPMVTSFGSFCCNNTFEFVGDLSDAARACYRGVCVQSGFASVGVIPVRHGNQVLGAIHLADERENRLPLPTTEFIESMSPLVGAAVYRFSIEDALKESEQRLQSVVQSSCDGILVTDSQMNIALWNLSAEKTFGYTESEVLGRAVTVLLPERSIEDFRQELERHRLTGLFSFLDRPREMVVRRKDGTEFPVEVGIAHWETEGQHFWSGIIRDLTERKQAEQRVQELARQVVLAQEDERQRVSRELHDEVGQALTAAKIHLETVRADWPLESARPSLDEAISIIGEAMTEMRLLAQGLRPAALDAAGLYATLEDYCREFARGTGLVIDYAGVDPGPLATAVSISLYRLLQEALTNAVKHARATWIRVALQKDSTGLALSVEYDGRGFDAARTLAAAGVGNGRGLVGMRERLRLMEGWLEIDSAAGQPTRLVAHVPV